MKDKIIILDTETTDASNEPWMIQLWYIVCDMDLNEIKRENLFFNPWIEIGYEAMAIHHITPEILRKEIEKDGRLDEDKRKLAMKDFENSYLVAHNSPFDKNVLDCNGIPTEERQWIDSYNIAYSIYADADYKHNLQYLRYRLQCEFNEDINPHDALSDVIVLKEVFNIICKDFNTKLLSTDTILESMIWMTKRGIILRKWAFWKHKDESFEESFEMDPWYFEWMYNSKINDWKTDDAIFNTLSFYLWKK